MANSYTNTLRLIEMGNGDQSGTWGATTNQNLATLLCQAITGVTTVTLSSTAKTLTAYDGVSDESRNAVIKLDGTPGGIATVKVPNSTKVYIFKNATSGGYAVTIENLTAGTGVSIPNGATMLVYTDGTNVYEGITAANGGEIVTTTGTQTLTNKTLTAPKFADGGFIADTSGNEVLVFDTAVAAVNEITISNSSSGGPTIASSGTSGADIDLLLVAKGSGVVKADGDEVATLTASQTLSGKTLTAPKFADLGYIADANSNELIVMATTTNAVNQLKIANAASGNPVTISATGDGADVGLNLVTKGSGTLQYNGTQIATTADIPTGGSTQSAQTGSYTLALTDAGKTVTMDSGSANTLTVPTNASVAFPTGTRIDVLQLGTGQTSIVGDTGVTVYKYNIAVGTTAKIAGQYAAATLWKQNTNIWYLVGNLTT
jgi:hypothetical protein